LVSKTYLDDFCDKNDIRKLSLFGSALRNELRPDSDLDLLVEFKPGHIPGLLDISRMEIQLSEVIGRKVDLRTPEELSRYFWEDVVRTAEVQYETA
jgi:uncharacterized protein